MICRPCSDLAGLITISPLSSSRLYPSLGRAINSSSVGNTFVDITAPHTIPASYLDRLDLKRPLAVQVLEQVALVRLVPTELISRHGPDVQPVDVRGVHHGAGKPLVPREHGADQRRSHGLGHL